MSEMTRAVRELVEAVRHLIAARASNDVMYEHEAFNGLGIACAAVEREAQQPDFASHSSSYHLNGRVVSRDEMERTFESPADAVPVRTTSEQDEHVLDESLGDIHEMVIALHLMPNGHALAMKLAEAHGKIQNYLVANDAHADALALAEAWLFQHGDRCRCTTCQTARKVAGR